MSLAPSPSPPSIRPWIWLSGLAVTMAIIAIPLFLFVPGKAAADDDPWAGVPNRVPDTNHAALLPGPYETGSDVTRACLECHPDAAEQVMGTTHWTWLADPVEVPGRDEPVAIGKANSINNFCIGIRGNEAACTTCHAGYGWTDETFDFTDEGNVDCLVCHDQSGQYVKGKGGIPIEGVDLAAAAQSVGTPTRDNCGSCHFEGGGGDGVKHGDLDSSLLYPSDALDVHMGEHDFTCIDCHHTTDHQIEGRAISVSLDHDTGITCTNCHAETPHEDERLNDHISAIACETCHIPAAALQLPTKMYWDWSTAGQDLPEDPHTYLKIKGSFIYEDNIVPDYAWSDGTVDRYLLGDTIDPSQVTSLNTPNGSIDDPDAKIYPFKIHRAIQIYDSVFDRLIQPKTFGEGGYWTEFDWQLAAQLGSDAVGLDYSGEYGWAETDMHWPINHMVQPAERALQCNDCHGDGQRLDWTALGYDGDPILYGGRGDE